MSIGEFGKLCERFWVRCHHKLPSNPNSYMYVTHKDGWISPTASAGVPSNTGRSTGAVDSVVVDFRNLPNGKRRRLGQCHGSTAPSYLGTLPGDRRPENICVPNGDGHMCDRRNCTTESFRPKTKCRDGTVYVSTTGTTPGGKCT